MLENIFNDNKDKLKLYYPDSYFAELTDANLVRCPHCGKCMHKQGYGAHTQGGDCLASRNQVLATLQGYIQTSVQWNKYTSCFMKRFWTGWQAGSRKGKGSLVQQVWIEREFYALWRAHSTIKRESAKLFNTAKVSHVPHSEFEAEFLALAKHKRNGATKKMEAVLGILELRKEEQVNAQFVL